MDEKPKKPSASARKRAEGAAKPGAGSRRSPEEGTGTRAQGTDEVGSPSTPQPEPGTRPEPEPPEPQAPASEPEPPDPEADQREPVNVFALAQFYLTIFADLAFQRMGLHVDAVAGAVVKDMEQAKAAVDITAFLADQLMPKVGDAGRRELMSLVRDLRLNYAKQAAEGKEA